MAVYPPPYLPVPLPTYAADELQLVDEVGLVVVELPEEAFAPVAVLVEEEEEVFEVDFVFEHPVGEVLVHEVQQVDLLVGDWVRRGYG